MSDVNGLSDNEKDTDTESLPEVVHSKPVKNCNDKNVWKLHQNVSDLESTDESDLEPDTEEPKARPKPKNRKHFEISSSSSTVKISSKGKGIKIKTDNADSYNVDTEVFTVAFSKKHPESIKINPIPKLVTKKKEEVVKSPVKLDADISDDDDDDLSDDEQITANDLVQVSFEDYEDIFSKENAKISLIQELRSYEACIIQKEEPNIHDDQERLWLHAPQKQFE